MSKSDFLFKICVVLFSPTHLTRFISNRKPPDSAPPTAPPSLPNTSLAPPQWSRSFPHTLPPDRRNVCIHEAWVCTVSKGCGVLGRVSCDCWDESVWQSGSRRRRSSGLWWCVYLRQQLSVSLSICCWRGTGLDWNTGLLNSEQPDLTWNLWAEARSIPQFHPSGQNFVASTTSPAVAWLLLIGWPGAPDDLQKHNGQWHYCKCSVGLMVRQSISEAGQLHGNKCGRCSKQQPISSWEKFSSLEEFQSSRDETQKPQHPCWHNPCFQAGNSFLFSVAAPPAGCFWCSSSLSVHHSLCSVPMAITWLIPYNQPWENCLCLYISGGDKAALQPRFPFVVVIFLCLDCR